MRHFASRRFWAAHDALKLECVRFALRRGDVAAAAEDPKVFESLPLAS